MLDWTETERQTDRERQRDRDRLLPRLFKDFLRLTRLVLLTVSYESRVLPGGGWFCAACMRMVLFEWKEPQDVE